MSEVNDDGHNVLDLRELEKSIRDVPGMGAKRTEAVTVLIEEWMGVANQTINNYNLSRYGFNH